MKTDIQLIEQLAVRAGMKSMLNHGAASLVFTEGVEGVSQEQLVRYTEHVALHCVAALAAAPAADAVASVAREDFDKMSADLTRAKNLLVRLWDKHPAARAQIEASTGTWFVWGQDRDAAAAQPQQATLHASADVVEMLAAALAMFVGTDPVHSLCQHEGMDAFGRVKGTWSAAAEANARAALKILATARAQPQADAAEPTAVVCESIHGGQGKLMHITMLARAWPPAGTKLYAHAQPAPQALGAASAVQATVRLTDAEVIECINDLIKALPTASTLEFQMALVREGASLAAAATTGGQSS